MEIDSTEDFLKKFDYNYQRNNNQLIIEMDFSQKISIDFSNPEKVKITNKVIGWNFLTGIINMTIKNAAIFNLISGLILGFIFFFIDIKTGIFFLIALVIWVLSWYTFYLSKTDTLKHFLINWSK
ncbi:hypothetical protein APS56_14855 [Pseudalgibacter alginicilyticus]|uniref:Uncharacterized protein n=1 Tax=Pseudalgibacter alginicilyticus TaxID=1736674 RepID=A0A0P0CJE7_9FLAO|nr:hypothetical protein [Pseudalgibacter alginicilyticus]ALJ06338.1 hypothetical protein APS56_14855 [Pseudalgibacter alginicilyticus]